MKRWVLGVLVVVGLTGGAWGQDPLPTPVDVRWNEYHRYGELVEILREVEAAYPELVQVEEIGRSREGRPLLVATVTDPAGGPAEAKPGMWIDGNVHGNEVQAAEAVLYTLWYLTRAHGRVPALTELLQRCTFYLMPSVNPDGRERWFDGPSTPHSSRHGSRPVDDDWDGRVDEDGPNDLDGDGQITFMWGEDPGGRWRRDLDDPRRFVRVGPDEVGGWERLGWEGIDDDGDGRINEDGVGGDDLNRNWPSGWQPGYIQYGASEYPLSEPESRAIAEFLLARPNVAAVQSYHNAGGMILRGPGAPWREDAYPREDQRVYQAIAEVGEELLPYYRSMVIHADLYTVHGGFVNWTAEGLGIVSFTNELWTPHKAFQGENGAPRGEREALWRDRLRFGQAFTDYTEVEHPQLGRVWVGGPTRWAGRATPVWMLEEECHRNFAFTMFHADQMPRVTVRRTRVEAVGEGVWAVTVELSNDRWIPTRTGRQQRAGIGRHDLLRCVPLGPAGVEAEVVASGRVSSWRGLNMEPVRAEPGRVQLAGGIPSHGAVVHRFVVSGVEGARVRVEFSAERALDQSVEVELRAP